ncbi:MAG TPA: PhnD/SsuA/transferrin family substrate-binding protein [Xanthobacteraceae bacterium]|nr:PhnD/SsuA/transferrin family substrate-binding protein [Xanthobacteraceae bacterium]
MATAGVVTLGMYDLPWVQGANDTLWARLRRALADAGWDEAPAAIERGRPIEAMLEDPHLLLGHTCGYPLRTRFAGRLRLVATPVYRSPYAEGARHRSVLLVRADDPARSLEDLRGRVAAINGFDSNTGMNLLRAAVAPLAAGGRFFGAVSVTGAHLDSLAAVAEGRAAIAAIDGVTYAIIARHAPERIAGVRALGVTPDTPGLPLVTRLEAPDALVAALRAALAEALADPATAPARAALGLIGFEVLPEHAYDRVLELERSAQAAGYPHLG